MTYLLLSLSRFKGVPGPTLTPPAIRFLNAAEALLWLQRLMKETYLGVNAWRTTSEAPESGIIHPLEQTMFERIFSAAIQLPNPNETDVNDIRNWLPDRILANLWI